MKSSCSALTRRIREEIVERCYYIDRITVQVNDTSLREPVESILRKTPLFVGAKMSPDFEKSSKLRKSGTGRIAVKFVVELWQPSMALLDELADCLVNAHYSISWLEVAYDMNLNSRQEANDCFNLLTEMIVVPSIAKAPTFKDREDRASEDSDNSHKSVFFGRYEDKRMFKMYIPAADRKMFGETSVHTEFVLKGAEAIRRNDLVTLEDLVELDYAQWYGERVWACGLDKKAIGASMRRWEAKEPASDRQCQKDFDRAFEGERATAHLIYHHESSVLREGLVACDKWLDGPVR